MRKTFAVFACLSVMMLTAASYREIRPQPGYTLANAHVHNCKNGKHWDGRQKQCVR